MYFIMLDKKLLIKTFNYSLLIQLITGIINVYGLTIKIDKKDQVLHDVLLLETIVQFVEGFWYIIIAQSVDSMDSNILTKRRYIDWIITTPVMLLSTILFMKYDEYKKENKVVKSIDIIRDSKDPIIKIIVLNFLMLVFGYLGETNMFNKFFMIGFGFICFFIYFYELWVKFASKTLLSRYLYYFLIIVWALYGIAAMFPKIEKNIFYNCLDIIAKNFYGLWIFWLIIKD